MNYEIKGGEFPIVICTLNRNESIMSERGGMAWMSYDFEMETTTGGGILKGLGRSLSGESMFLNRYTSRSDNQFIGFASTFSGKILDLNLKQGQSIIAQKRSMLAMEETIDMKIHFKKKLGVGFFGGEGFILQKFTGEGNLFLEIDGDLIEYNLQPGEKLKIDQGYLAAMESSVSFDIETVKGIKNVLFGGEGLFVGVLTGPGKVWLQTMPLSVLTNEILSHVPRS